MPNGSNDQLVLLEELESGIFLVSLNRPEKKNALNQELLSALLVTFDNVHQKAHARVLMIRGLGDCFCAGLDLKETKCQSDIETSAQLIAKSLSALRESPLVTIALVHGAAIAGGAGLFCSCDLAIGASNSQIGFPETRRGLVAALITAPLKRLLKGRDLKELLLLGIMIDAQKALNIGLLNSIVASENLLDEGLRMARLVLQGAPGATAMTKKLIDALEPNDFSQDLAVAMKYHQMARQSPECQEGSAAFFEKRAPNWVDY